MSQPERDRLECLKAAREKRITQVVAAERIEASIFGSKIAGLLPFTRRFAPASHLRRAR